MTLLSNLTFEDIAGLYYMLYMYLQSGHGGDYVDVETPVDVVDARHSLLLRLVQPARTMFHSRSVRERSRPSLALLTWVLGTRDCTCRAH